MKHLLAPAMITGLALIISSASANQWYWQPSNPKGKCTIATYSPADVAEKLAIFGTHIVEKEGGMVIVLLDAQDGTRSGPMLMGSHEAFLHQVFFRTEKDCATYQTQQEKEEETKQRQYQEELQKYR
jgi:hypothetical protein